MIYYQAENIAMPKISKRKVSAWIKEVATRHGYRVGEISYLFCDDEKILEVNREYLQHDYYTDIITFDYTEGDKINGDLFISLDTVKSNSEKFATSYEEEFYRVVIHGILHLCGFKDKEEAEEARMREEENKAISSLEKPLKK